MEISGPSSTDEENRFFVPIRRRGKRTRGAGAGSTDRLSFCLTEEQGQLLRRRRHCCAQPERLQTLEFMGKGEAMLGNLRDVPSSNVLKTAETE